MGGGCSGSSRHLGSGRLPRCPNTAVALRPQSLPRTAAWKGPRLASTAGPASAATSAPTRRLQQVGSWSGRRCAGSSGGATFGIQIKMSIDLPSTSS
eukprot:15459163-Alexandrium_andersonii.AAC.1